MAPLRFRSGSVQPGIGSVIVLCVLLSFGFLTACAAGRSPALGRTGWYALVDLLRRRWGNPRLLLVSLLALFLWPLSVLLHLTSAGWELGNRMNAFAFVGAGLVVAFGGRPLLARSGAVGSRDNCRFRAGAYCRRRRDQWLGYSGRAHAVPGGGRQLGGRAYGDRCRRMDRALAWSQPQLRNGSG